MTIEITPIRRTFRYNGIALPDVPGLEPREVRDLYSAQYPELISAEVEAGEIRNGEQEFTFRKAVGVKGATSPQGKRLAALRQSIQAEAEGRCGIDPRLGQVLTYGSVVACARAWSGFVESGSSHTADVRVITTTATSEMLAPLP